MWLSDIELQWVMFSDDKLRLGKGPKIKKARKNGPWPYSADPLPPITLTIVFLLRISKICTGNGKSNTKNWFE